MVSLEKWSTIEGFAPLDESVVVVCNGRLVSGVQVYPMFKMNFQFRCLAVSLTALFTTLLSTAQITLDPLPSTSLCANTSVDVMFQASGTFDPGNTFTVELSNATGSFAPPVEIGSISAIGSGTVSCTIPATAGTGFRLRVKSSSPVVVGDVSGIDLTISTPNAGVSGVVTVCASGAPFSLFPVLGGAPDAGGTWVDLDATGGQIGGVLNPGLLTSGTYVFSYTVDLSGCTDVAHVTVTVVQALDAGLNASLTVCSNDPPFQLWSQLGGTPDPGGSWMSPAGNPIPLSFDPAVDPAGVYSYVVVADPPCANATAALAITVVQAASAGADAALTWCASAGPFILIEQLSGTPQPGGTWTFAGSAHGPAFIPGVDTPGLYVYSVPSAAPCMTATAELMVTIGACLTTPAPQLGIQYLTE